jgi:hypothetical protein
MEFLRKKSCLKSFRPKSSVIKSIPGTFPRPICPQVPQVAAEKVAAEKVAAAQVAALQSFGTEKPTEGAAAASSGPEVQVSTGQPEPRPLKLPVPFLSKTGANIL